MSSITLARLVGANLGADRVPEGGLGRCCLPLLSTHIMEVSTSRNASIVGRAVAQVYTLLKEAGKGCPWFSVRVICISCSS